MQSVTCCYVRHFVLQVLISWLTLMMVKICFWSVQLQNSNVWVWLNSWCHNYRLLILLAHLQLPTWQKKGSPWISGIGQRSQMDFFGRLKEMEVDRGKVRLIKEETFLIKIQPHTHRDVALKQSAYLAAVVYLQCCLVWLYISSIPSVGQWKSKNCQPSCSGAKMSIIWCFIFVARWNSNSSSDAVCEIVFVESGSELKHLPSVKLHFSHPAEEGVLHGDTPSSAPETKSNTNFKSKTWWIHNASNDKTLALSLTLNSHLQIHGSKS